METLHEEDLQSYLLDVKKLNRATNEGTTLILIFILSIQDGVHRMFYIRNIMLCLSFLGEFIVILVSDVLTSRPSF